MNPDCQNTQNFHKNFSDFFLIQKHQIFLHESKSFPAKLFHQIQMPDFFQIFQLVSFQTAHSKLVELPEKYFPVQQCRSHKNAWQKSSLQKQFLKNLNSTAILLKKNVHTPVHQTAKYPYIFLLYRQKLQEGQAPFLWKRQLRLLQLNRIL